MSMRGLVMREEAGGRLRIAGKFAGVATPGYKGTYRLVFNDRDPARRTQIDLTEAAFDELEDIITALRVERPRFESSRPVASLIMKKFMLDNAVFPTWPARQMAETYRIEGAYIEYRTIQEWRHALDRPRSMRAEYSRLLLSVSRREVNDYGWLVVSALADKAAAEAPEWYAQTGRWRVVEQIERNLVSAYPHDGYDQSGALIQARLSALARILPDAVSAVLPPDDDRAMSA